MADGVAAVTRAALREAPGRAMGERPPNGTLAPPSMTQKGEAMTAPAEAAEARPFPIPPDLEGFWQFDRVHAPRPLTPLSQEVLLPAFAAGITAGLREVDYPHGFTMRAINHFGYVALLPHHAQGEELARLLVANQRTMTSLLPRVTTLWEREWLPAILPGLERLRTLDYGSLPDAALLDVFEALRVDLRARWVVHGRILLVYLAASDFEDFYRDQLQPTNPTEPYLLLHGFPTRALDSSRGLWELSRRVAATPALRRPFRHTAPADLAAVLAQTAAGRAFLGELHGYLETYGWRNDAVFELADPTWREDPTRPLAAIQGQWALPADADPEVQRQRAARQRDTLLERARARLAADPVMLARFDELYARARSYLPIDEDHNFYIDQMGNAGLRLPILELGRRLTHYGVLAAPNDVFLLHLDEIGAGLAGVDQRAAAATRRAELQHWAAVVPPDTLGVWPADTGDGGDGGDLADPLLAALSKQDTTPGAGGVSHGGGDGEAGGASDGLLLTGTPAAPGVVRGRARVARSLMEACAAQPGEVLVCEMTLPTWTPLFATVAAVVADTGGVLSHCAIVAREYGIACVVGTQVGTRTITDGAVLTVDGARGTVRVQRHR